MSGRPRPNLQINAPTEDNGMKITDTMTLVIKDDGGKELRVKDSGMAGGGGQTHTPTDRASTSQPEAVLNAIRFDDLRIGEVLGQGSQGKVRVVQHRETQEKYALKSLQFSSDDKDAMRVTLQNELRQVAFLKHPNVVSSYEAFFRDGKLYIVLEYMDCGTMTSVMKRMRGGFPEDKLAYVAVQFLEGLHHLHNHKVIHRDIKPANVLCNSKGEVKISDFGVAKTFAGDDSQNLLQTASAMGSTPYMSPERIQSQPYSFSCDVWSCGITIAECALGVYPFGELKSKIFELCQAIASNQAQVDWSLGGGRAYSPELVDFVNQCLRPQQERPTAAQLLNHPFLDKAKGLNPAEVGAWFLRPQ